MFSLLGVLAVIVAAAGLFSVMSYLVTQRSQEFGVRMALGAKAFGILLLVLRGSVLLALMGVLIGTVIALGMSRFIEPLLFDTSARDPLVIGGVGVVLLLVAVAASVLPAMRAKRVNPMDALRAE